MTKSKKYYWLKLKSDFFDDDTIKYIEEQENGIKYSNFYLKLCLKSLKTEGKLMRLIGETLIPYDISSLAKLTSVDFDTVRNAMELFTKIGLVKIMDSGEIYLSQIDELIGSETDKAQIMRRLRAENKKEIGNNVTGLLPKCYTEKEIEIEKEIEKENRFIKPTVEEIQRYINEKNLNIDANKFYDFYESKGWLIGKNKMKDWKACIRTWKRNSKDNNTLKNTYNTSQGYEDLSQFYAN